MASEAGLRRSPLQGCHERLGAHFTTFAGWQLPLRYGSELAEHRAVRGAVGLFDLSHMAELAVTGPAAVGVLEAALVGAFDDLAVGRARYSLCCQEDGGILDDLVVYRFGPEELLVVANAANRLVVAEALAAAAEGRDAEVVDQSDEMALLALQGPSSATVLRRITSLTDGAVLAALPSYGCAEVELLGAGALVGRTGYTGEDGFECLVPSAVGPALFEAFLLAGRPEGLVPAGLAARDSLRLEAGMALYGNELSVEVTPDEAGLGRLVRLDKRADFTGRAVIERRRADPTEPRRRLVGLLGEGRRAGRHGYDVLDPGPGPDSGSEGPGERVRPIGMVTSGALSPTLGRPVAMAYVEAALAEPGRHLGIDVRGQLLACEVTHLPFYRRRRGGPGALS